MICSSGLHHKSVTLPQLKTKNNSGGKLNDGATVSNNAGVDS